MDNYAIAGNFSVLAKIMDIHGQNSFKSKSYASAAFAIEKLPVQLSAMPPKKITSIKGIGDSIGKKVIEQLTTGRLAELDNLIIKTPGGVLEMMQIKGLGPKKIATIWKDLEIENLGELLYACSENRLLLYKGFGKKNQQNIKEAIDFFFNSKGNFLYAHVEELANINTTILKKQLGKRFVLTGDMRRHAEIIDKLEWVTDVDGNVLEQYLIAKQYAVEKTENLYKAVSAENMTLLFYLAIDKNFYTTLFETTGNNEFITRWKNMFGERNTVAESEEAIFADNNLQYIPPYLRETPAIIGKALQHQLPQVITTDTIKGIIHCHSNWSDGINTLNEMAAKAIDMGLEYLVISDHSKSAFYANGLQPNRVKEQHYLIDELNAQLAPFTIFKSIESDILNDGNLDYDPTVLASFDLVIASIHSNLKMTEDKAMARLLKAIENPFTNILGHLTGRLLLSRNGYPVNINAIVDACAAHNVVIELNAHPRRLDIDWRWIEKALAKKVLISINPDSHAAETFTDSRFGVLAAQKAGLTTNQNLSSFSLQEFRHFLCLQHQKRP